MIRGFSPGPESPMYRGEVLPMVGWRWPMGSTRCRPVVPIVGAVVLTAVFGFQLTGHVSAWASRRTQGRMIAVALRMDDPAGLLARDRATCFGDAIVRCLEGEQDPYSLAASYRTALSQAAGRAAGLRCDTLPPRDGRQLRSCLVRVDDGSHAVLVSIDSRPVRAPEGITLSGSNIAVEAD